MRMTQAAILQARHGERVVLEEVQADAVLRDLFAEVTVMQRYRNAEATNIEAVYTFPLPVDGVLLGLEVRIGERRLTGTVVEKSEAEQRYEDAVVDGDAAVMLEQPQPGLYTASVGNLLPGETAEIRFRYGLLLRWNGDLVRFMLPTTIAPRYGDPGAGRLAPHQSPEYGFHAERSFSLRIAVRGLLKDARFNSPSHDVGVTTQDRETIVEVLGRPAMDRDFVLEARAAQPRTAAAILSPDVDGWVALASFRPDIPDLPRSEPRTTKIVVDCSGSMGGDSIAQARAALERILDGLRTGDAFEILAFGSRHVALFDREMPVSETSLAKARRFIRGLDANLGGTEIGAALEAAYRTSGESDRPRDLLLITDGEVWNTQSVIAQARASGHRIFTVGVGSAVAEAFVRELAEATGGACELVSPREDMAERIHRHFQRMYAPRARSAAVRWPSAPQRHLPEPLTPVYGGDTVHAFAWFPHKPEGTVALEVSLADGQQLRLEADVSAVEEAETRQQEPTPPALARLAATRRLSGMTDHRAVADLAVRYQLMSPWTNYLVVHVRAEAEKAEDLPQIRKVPQVLAAGWHGLGSVSRMSKSFMGKRSRAFRREQSLDAYDGGEEILRRSMPRQQVPAEAPYEATPEQLVARLNRRPHAALPSLKDLETWGVPQDVLETLRGRLVSGESEQTVILLFLYLLAESDAGKDLDRQLRRRVRKAFRQAFKEQGVYGEVLLDEMKDAIRRCLGWATLAS